jgi:hypothetical protein
MPQRYGAQVSIALSGNSVLGYRGFTTYLERLQPGTFVLKLDASLADSEYSVSAQVINPPVGMEQKWSVQTWKVMNPPAPRPPGSYLVVITAKDGIPTDIDFDVTAVTFN